MRKPLAKFGGTGGTHGPGSEPIRAIKLTSQNLSWSAGKYYEPRLLFPMFVGFSHSAMIRNGPTNLPSTGILLAGFLSQKRKWWGSHTLFNRHDTAAFGKVSVRTRYLHFPAFAIWIYSLFG